MLWTQAQGVRPQVSVLIHQPGSELDLTLDQVFIPG